MEPVGDQTRVVVEAKANATTSFARSKMRGCGYSDKLNIRLFLTYMSLSRKMRDESFHSKVINIFGVSNDDRPTHELPRSIGSQAVLIGKCDQCHVRVQRIFGIGKPLSQINTTINSTDTFCVTADLSFSRYPHGDAVHKEDRHLEKH